MKEKTAPEKRDFKASARNIIGLLTSINRDFFLITLATYLFLFMLETIEQGFVTFFFELDVLLWIVMVSGILLIVSTGLKPEDLPGEIDKKPGRRSVFYLGVSALVFVALLFTVTSDLGRSVIPLFAGMGVALFILLERIIAAGRELEESAKVEDREERPGKHGRVF